MDGRRRQWFPLASDFMHGRLATRMQNEFGPAGPLVWVALLAACKRAPIQGRLSYTTEGEFWALLGFVEPPPIDLEQLLRRLGQLKKISRTRSGQRVNISVTRWGDWNNPDRTRFRQRQTTRSKAGFAGQTLDKSRSIPDPDSDSESESESDSDSDSSQFMKPAMDEVLWRMTTRGDEIKNAEALAKTIAECYAGHPTSSVTACKSPMHGREALGWHRGRREDEDQEARASRARTRRNSDESA